MYPQLQLKWYEKRITWNDSEYRLSISFVSSFASLNIEPSNPIGVSDNVTNEVDFNMWLTKKKL